MSRLVATSVLSSIVILFGGNAQADSGDADAAPTILSFRPDSSSFLYVEIELVGGQRLKLGFEHDGDEWSFAEQYGSPGEFQGQLDTFVAYTIAILASPSCAVDPVYSPAEEETIADYVKDVEHFCQNHLPGTPDWVDSLGNACWSHDQCASGVCFDLQDSQTYWPWCFGTICTVTCNSNTYCQQLAAYAGAPNPGDAVCEYAELLELGGTSGHDVCDFIPAGLGTMGCE